MIKTVSLVRWLRKHQSTILWLLVLSWIVWQVAGPSQMFPSNMRSQTHNWRGEMLDDEVESGYGGGLAVAPEPAKTIQPEPNVAGRMIQRQTDLSLVVTDVNQVAAEIVTNATGLNGYLVNSNLSQTNQQTTATVTVRVPSDKLDTLVQQIKNQAIKVVSENTDGQDITEEYTDINEHLRLLQATKAKYETIRQQATQVNELVQVTRELTNIQQQIDRYEGRKRALEQRAQTSLVTVYLATDELALPYTPSEQFRPKVIFKLAVRSLVQTGYSLMSKLIWLLVYAVIWLPLSLVGFWTWRRYHQS